MIKKIITSGKFRYHRVQSDWHRLDTPEGTFFGTTRDEVFNKAIKAEGAAVKARENMVRVFSEKVVLQ